MAGAPDICGRAMFEELLDYHQVATLGCHMQGKVPIRPRLIDIRAPVQVAIDLIQIPDVDGALEVDGRFGRLAAGHDQHRRQA